MRADPDFRPFLPGPVPPPPRLPADPAPLTLALFPTLFALISGPALGLVLMLEPGTSSASAMLASGLLGAALGWPAAWLVATRILR